MKRRRLIFQLLPFYMVIVLVAVFVLSWYAIRVLRAFHLEDTAKDLRARAILVRDQITRENLLRSPVLLEVCQELGQRTGTRITVIGPAGKVLADSDEDPQEMDNHGDRPEVMEAYQRRTGTSVRYSYTLKQDMMYLAIPLYKDGEFLAVVRTSIPLTRLQQTIGHIQSRIIMGGIIIALVAALLSFMISRRITKPLEEIKRGADRFARGEFHHKLVAPNTEEIGGVTDALNQMAEQLDERIRTILKHRNEQEAVLTSMIESVLAVDTEERILWMNQAAAELFEVNIDEVSGQSVYEAIRNANLQRFIPRVLSADYYQETELSFENSEEHFLQAHGTALRDADGSRIGALIVLNDITRLKQLENMRREFVANVTHELKTPITSIQGFVETLRDGAIDHPEDAKRFLEIIGKHTDRLKAIVDDLLDLSQIEQEHKAEEITLTSERVYPVLNASIGDCEMSASRNNIRLELDCPQDLMAMINPLLLQNAVVNLIDNAINCSDSDSRVRVSARKDNSNAVITVQDWGCGIADEHLPRIFERFYRVDPGRSRKQGGTGLGLAIVKHIVLAHHGELTVESQVDKGSIFRISLPIADS
jgi:two-component system phosphate regulon sensor histidine kinase PhoR